MPDPSPASLPAHGPGCIPTIGHNTRFPGEPRYICTANCPRKWALDGGVSPASKVRPRPDQPTLFDPKEAPHA